MAGLGDALAIALTGAIQGRTRRRAQNYAHDDQLQAERENYQLSAPARYDALTRTDGFRRMTPEQQTALGESAQMDAGPYSDRIHPVGTRIGQRTTLTDTGNFLQGPPSPSQADYMLARGVDRPSGGYPEQVQSTEQILQPAFTPPPAKAPTLGELVNAAKLRSTLTPESQTSYDKFLAGGTAASGIPALVLNPPQPRPQTPEQIAHFRSTDQTAYLRTEPGTFDSAATTTLPNKRLVMENANVQRAALGLPALPVVGTQIGVDPTRPIEGPRPTGQMGPGLPVPRPILATLPRSAALQKTQTEQAAAERKRTSDALLATRKQGETERAAKAREEIQRKAQAQGWSIAKTNAELRRAGLAQDAKQFEIGQAATQNRFDRTMIFNKSKPAPGSVTPAQQAAATAASRRRAADNVEAARKDREKALAASRLATRYLESGVNIEDGTPWTPSQIEELQGRVADADKAYYEADRRVKAGQAYLHPKKR